MSTSVHQTGQPPRDCITFGIPDPEGLDSWQSGEFGCDALLTFGAAEGFESISNERHVGIVLQFKEADLKAFSEASGYDLPDMVYNTQMFQAGGQRQRLRELKNRILLLLGSDTVRWSVSLREELMLQAIAVLSGGRAEIAKRSSAKRRTILKKTVGLMKDTEDRVVPISSMCKEVGASWRTINRAFFDEFGMGPKAYYTRLRLNRARLAIIRGEGAISISDAANRFEFWHMGQFARDYRSLFGELPSETLNRIKTQYIPGLR
jgi:AraC-like DNA-binding protein